MALPLARRALLFVGSSVVLWAAAADARPRVAEPPGASAVCDRYGPGYRQLASTDTCIKISGNARVEFGVVSGGGHEVGAYLGRPRR